MEYLRLWFRPSQTWSSPVPSFQIIRPNIYQMTTLPGLPSDLLLKIFDLLPFVDLKCLSLCNRHLYRLSSRYYGYSSRSRMSTVLARADKLSILARLERDLPKYFACYFCQRLHQYDGSESFGLSGPVYKKTCRLPCDYKGFAWWKEVSAGTTMSLATHIHFTHSRNRISHHQLKLAMRRYRFGPIAGIHPESLSYTQIRFYLHPLRTIPWFPPKISPFIPTLFSIEAQICSEPLGLHIRMQDIILFDRWEDSKVVPESNPISIYNICLHIKLSSKISDLDTLNAYLVHSSFLAGTRKDPHINYTCSRCNTVCLIEISPIESKIALIMTRWINLGPGLDHEDPLWRIRVSWSSAPRPEQLPQSMMTKNPRFCYENQDPGPLERLQIRNLSYLTKGKYQKPKPFIRLNRVMGWYIPYQELSKERKREFT